MSVEVPYRQLLCQFQLILLENQNAMNMEKTLRLNLYLVTCPLLILKNIEPDFDFPVQNLIKYNGTVKRIYPETFFPFKVLKVMKSYINNCG